MASENTWALIKSDRLTSAQASYTFSNIPQTYTDLYLRFSVRASSTSGNSNLFIYLNGTTGTSYKYYTAVGTGNGSWATRAIQTSQPWFELLSAMPNESGTFTSNTFANGEMWFGDYRSSTYKAICSTACSESNITSTQLGVQSGTFTSNSPITSITIDGTDNFVANSTFYLYGLLRSDATTNV